MYNYGFTCGTANYCRKLKRFISAFSKCPYNTPGADVAGVEDVKTKEDR